MLAAVWMTGTQQKRLTLFGDVLQFDAAFTATKEQFRLFLPTILDQNRRARRVAGAMGEGETAVICAWILRSMKEMCPSWRQDPVIIADAFMSDNILHGDAGFTHAELHLCTWHMITLDITRRFSNHTHAKDIIAHAYHLRDCTTTSAYDMAYVAFSAKFPDAVDYMARWHARRQQWCRAWTFRRTTLGLETSSPVEASNASVKQLLKYSDGTLLGLLNTW